MSDRDNLLGLVAGHIEDAGTQWSVGVFGGIAEFARDPGEPVTIERTETGVSAFTDRGGIAVKLRDDVIAFASESLTRHAWTHRVSLCLPEEACAMNRRSGLTELGPDVDALREQDRDGILFDLGLEGLQVDLCVRIRDADVIAKLRECIGKPVFDHDNPAMGYILASSPHRVFISRIGRAEVYQAIPPATGKSPEGPHTHVLPRLLRSGRTHSATEPVPSGYVPCLHFYPEHPVRDSMGQPVPFDAGRHERFQSLLSNYGAADTLAIKQRVNAAIEAGQLPPSDELARDRVARTSLRVALRQLRAAGMKSLALDAWCEAYDRVEPTEDDDEQAIIHGH